MAEFLKASRQNGLPVNPGRGFDDRGEAERAKPFTACLPAAGRVYRANRVSTSYSFVVDEKVCKFKRESIKFG